MTFKEKALELYNLFYIPFSKSDACFGYCDSEELTVCDATGHGCGLWKKYAKQCALLCVDEIDEALDFDPDYIQNLDREHAWWWQVREEIEKI